jgi:hypothetical protein
MENLKKALLLLIFAFAMTSVHAQKVTTQAIDKPSEGKSLVYVMKTGAGLMVNFRIYDKDKFLGAIPTGKYLVYECEPGEHLFWATSENRDYIEANLEPNSVYVINAEGQMGAFVAGVNLKPMKPTEYRDKMLFYRVIKGDNKMPYIPSTDDKSQNVTAAMQKYQELKNNKSKKIAVLSSDMKFENADKPSK